jgi:Fe(3+) dicitrate transport protein
MAQRMPGLVAAVSLWCLCLAGAGDLVAQQATIEGIVRDAVGGAPLAGVEVRVVGGSVGAITGPAGRYVLQVPAGGMQQVEATRLGYAAQRQPVLLEVAGPARLDFTLASEPVMIGEIAVVGRRQEALARIPGSATVVTPAVLERTVPLSSNEVLRAVPGVHIQEEEGLGLRANIGIRGLDPDRSRNVLVLEDGVPVALNPYGEPEMYYSPPIDRMEGVEVVKGSGSILFGPQTVGGVINYRTPAPPQTPGGSVSVLGGQGGFRRVLGSYGGTWNQVGAFVSVLSRGAEDIGGHHFEVADVTGKVGFAVNPRAEVGVKLSVYDEVSNSTYIGLTEAMFSADPHRHASPNDRLRVRRYAATGTHALRLADNATLRTAVYGYTTTRNWQRQDYAYSADGSEIEFRESTGNRNRSFEVFGVEPRLQWDGSLLGLRSEVDAGVRALWESAEETYLQGGTATSRSGALRDHELRGGRALSGFVQSRFSLGGGLQLVPGLRVEQFGYHRHVLRTRVRRSSNGVVTRNPEDVDIRTSDRILELVPGAGVTWSPGDRLTLFAGVHRGFAPPRTKDALVYDDITVPVGQAPGDVISLQLDAERSVNSEVGLRANPWNGVAMEATAFLLDFSNQIIAASASAGSVADLRTANQGETRHTGLETAVEVNVGQLLGWPFGLTGSARHTHVRSEFTADRFMSRAGSPGLVNVRGNRLPYAPESLLNLGAGLLHPRGLSLTLDGTFVSEQFADNFETREPTPNGRLGVIPAYRVWNVAASYDLPVAGLRVFGTVKNLFDETYIASRRPEGIRPSTPRLLQLGVERSF